MAWLYDYVTLGHDTFIVFVECKIEGKWGKETIASRYGGWETHDILAAQDPKNSIVHLIEPDGLRRILHFTQGGTISINQNVLSYHSGHVNEITVDEKEQSGKGKIRDKL